MDTEDITVLEARITRLSEHPFFVDHFFVFGTNPIRRAYAAGVESLLVGGGGVYLGETPGGGKTAHAHYLVRRLRHRWPDLPVFGLFTYRLPPTARRSFSYRACFACGEDDPPNDPQRLRRLLERTAIEAALASPKRRMVFVVDESQDLRLEEFCILKDVGNAMALAGCSMAVCLLGERVPLLKRLEELRKDGHWGLLRRFAEFELPSLRFISLDDVRSALRELDVASLPEIGGRSICMDFFPKAYANKFRFEQFADALYEKLHREPGILACEIFGTIRHLVRKHSQEDHSNLKLTKKQLSDAIDANVSQWRPATDPSAVK